MSIMTRRVEIAQATLDAFRHRPFEWGPSDCCRLAAHAIKGAGYNPGLARGGSYTTEFGARRALKRAKLTGLDHWLDDLGFPRIPAAAALPGDIVGFRHPAQNGWTALSVALGNGRLLGFCPETNLCHVLQPDYLTADLDANGWRVEPCLP